jgi:class 3 adenylate cyclase/tetratricopeptide (TPR) repeat protein
MPREMNSIVQWLEGLGLGQYARAFVEADIEPHQLPELTEADLEKLGVTIGHRKQLARAIAGLAAEAAPPRPATSPVIAARGAAEAERRQLTVMFWDLVGSTALSARLDPEDLRVVIGAYHRCCTDVISRAGGFVAQFMGDGALAYFGYPRAHEDDAERAVLAGLDLVRAVGEVDVRTPLQARVGIATGLVVVGDLFGEVAAQRRAVVGETPNLAARLQELAAPGSVVIAAGTRRLVGRLFEYRALDPTPLKGFAEPVPAWQVLRASAEESRFEARQEGGLLPLVGREAELELLLRRWRRAKAGESQVVLLSGEAGIGKSRIVRALQDRLAAEPHVPVRVFCSPHHQGSALYPVISRLEHEAGFARDDSPEVKLGKLEALFPAGEMPEEEFALFATLLSLPAGDRYWLAEMSPQRRKEKTLAALLARIERLAARQPVLMVFEDLHWIDPTSLELLTLQIERWRTLPILLLITTRPEFTPPWSAAARVTTIALSRLDAGQVGALVERVAEGRKLPVEVLRQIVERTDGTPLFAEELTKAVLESGLLRPQNGHYVLDGPLPPLAIPTTLRDSLMARLDRLAEAREVAQIGAALGREFSYELLRAVVALPDDQLQGALRDLVRSGLVFARGAQPVATYSFKHALVQDAAYQSMLKSRRMQLHARIVDVMEPTFPGVVEAEPETLARHLTAAGLPLRAIPYWLAAGRRALRRGAHQEAIGHLHAGIALLDAVEDEAARVRCEIDLQAALGFALTANRGYAAPVVEAAFSRAHALCRVSGAPAQAIPVLRGFTTFHWVSGNLSTARDFGLQLAAIAEQTGDQEASLVAHGMLAGIHHHMGELAASDLHCAKLRVPYAAEARRNIVVRFGEDTPSVTWAYRGYNAAWFGDLDTASAAIEEAVAFARRTGHPFSIASALCRAAICSVIMRDRARAVGFAEPGLATARELGFPISRAIASVVLGWAAALDGNAADGVAEMREGIALWRSTGAAVALPCFFALLAEGLLAAGASAEAIAATEEGIEWGARKAEHASDCMLLVAHGDALRAVGEPVRAEASYQQALAWSRVRNAKWGELGAGMRLARLWRASGRAEAAHALLAPLCAWFPKTIEHEVLRDAQALCDALARAHGPDKL